MLSLLIPTFAICCLLLGAGSFAVGVLLVCVLYQVACKPKDTDEEEEEENDQPKTVNKNADDISVTSLEEASSQPSSPKPLRYYSTTQKPQEQINRPKDASPTSQ